MVPVEPRTRTGCFRIACRSDGIDGFIFFPIGTLDLCVFSRSCLIVARLLLSKQGSNGLSNITACTRCQLLARAFNGELYRRVVRGSRYRRRVPSLALSVRFRPIPYEVPLLSYILQPRTIRHNEDISITLRFNVSIITVRVLLLLRVRDKGRNEGRANTE